MTQPPFDISAVQRMTPEQYTEFIARLARELPTDLLIEERKKALRVIAAETDGYENFLAYYELIHGKALVEHDLEPVAKAFDAHAAGEMFEWLGFRGCRKTTTIHITLYSFLHGHHPEGTGVITGANDPNAKLIAKSISQIIENHPEFKLVFPYVTIDKDMGWGAEGYWIRRTHKVVDGQLKEISRGEWTAQQAKVNDPSFVGGGYKSSEINGKHPTLYLGVDDLHDIDSSSSATERENIKTVFIMQILPTLVSEGGKLLAWVNITGVPFSKDDTYAVLRNSGGVVFVATPVMKRAAEGEGTYIDGVNKKTGVVYDDIVGWWHLTWPENFTVDVIISWRSKGKSSFWQMFMLDIEIAKTAGLRYYLYPADKIGFDLPTGGGADPTSIDPDYEVGGKKRSSFALSYLCKLIDGRLALKGGVLKPMGIQAAREAILRAQAMFLNWITTAVENVGPGKMFMQFLRLDPKVRFRDSNIADPQGIIKDKLARFEGQVGPWLDAGILLISDDENDDYCMAVRGLCDDFFDIDPNRSDERLDAGDGLYQALKLFPEVLRNYVVTNTSPQAMAVNGGRGSLWHPLSGGRPNGR